MEICVSGYLPLVWTVLQEDIEGYNSGEMEGMSNYVMTYNHDLGGMSSYIHFSPKVMTCVIIYTADD